MKYKIKGLKLKIYKDEFLTLKVSLNFDTHNIIEQVGLNNQQVYDLVKTILDCIRNI